MKITFQLFVLLLVMLIGCKHSKKEEVSNYNLDFEIKIFPENSKEFPINQFYDSIRFVTLETNHNCLIEHIAKILYSNDKIIVFDQGRKLSQVLCFDHQGRFINRIGNKGKGPGEYRSLQDIDMIGNNIYLLDLNGEVYCYDLNGKFLDQINCKLPAQEICIVNDSTFLIGCDGGFPPAEDGYYLYLFINNTIRDKYFKIPTELNNGFSSVSKLTKINNKIYYIRPFSDIVYMFKNNQIEPHVKIDFNGFYKTFEQIAGSMSEKCEQWEYGLKLRQHLSNNQVVKGLSYYLEDDTFIEGIYVINKTTQGFIYNKNTKQVININNIKGNNFIFQGWGSLAFTNNSFKISYFVKTDFDNKDLIPIGNTDNPIVYFRENLKIEDNPVLIFTHFNPKIQ